MSAVRIGMHLHALVAKFKLLALNPNKCSTNVEAECVLKCRLQLSDYLLGKTKYINHKIRKVNAVTHMVTLETYLSLET